MVAAAGYVQAEALQPDPAWQQGTLAVSYTHLDVYKRQMFGSVAVIRESGVNSLRVGDIYYVGHLPWFDRIWFCLLYTSGKIFRDMAGELLVLYAFD